LHVNRGTCDNLEAFVSIIIPACNVNYLIEDVIKNALYLFDEVIVVDD